MRVALMRHMLSKHLQVLNMFEIKSRDFKNKSFGNEPYLSNWPMLYILENGKEAYVGESNHVIRRMQQHASTEEKRIFDKVHFIYSPQFNQSVTFDYESKLIQYIAADEIYSLRNKNSGIANKDYYRKEEFDKEFYDLWKRLREEHIVSHTIEELENSDLFKYSPYKELNADQRNAVDGIVSQIQDNPKQTIIVQGMPGSGKTIVAIFLMKYLRDSEEFADKSIGIVVPQTSLRQTLSDIFDSIYGLKAADVLSPADVTRKHYDILLVDEAHRLHQYKNISYRGAFKKCCERLDLTTDADELDWILKQCDCPILFYDKMQVVGPSGIDVERFQNKIMYGQQKRLAHYYELCTQMRVGGGKDYMFYINQLLDGTLRHKRCFEDYEFKLVPDFDAFNKLLYEKEESETLARMLAGFAWEWKTKNDPSAYDIIIEGISKKWNQCTKGWIHSEGAIDEVGCIHTAQGYDLNYAFIIFGREIDYDFEKNEIIINRDLYFDKNGKISATDEELKVYIKHIYYVLLTRGIRGTYLYAYNPNLRKYLSQFVEIFNPEKGKN